VNDVPTPSTEHRPGESLPRRRAEYPESPDDTPSLAEARAERGILIRLAYRFCWNIEDAEDAVQGALLRAATHERQLADPGKRWSWVRSIVVRQCHDIRRRAALRRKSEPALEERYRSHDEPRDPAGAAERSEFNERIRVLIGTLPERQQTALVLRHMEEMDYGQIAEIMGTSESTVRVQARNAREALRLALLKQDPSWAGGATRQGSADES
jgi:RNA polymerase sigma-70 factor (ECF subfamily)